MAILRRSTVVSSERSVSYVYSPPSDGPKKTEMRGLWSTGRESEKDVQKLKNTKDQYYNVRLNYLNVESLG